MHNFWAMDDADKIWLIVQYSAVTLFVLSVLFSAVLIIGLAIDGIADHISDKREQRQTDAYQSQHSAYSPADDPQVAVFQLKQVRRERQKERDEFFRNVEEIHNDLR